MKVFHYSTYLPAEGGTVNPKYFAKNEYTQAEKRALSIPRTFFYVDPKKREERFTNQSPLFEGDIPDEQVYDFDKDEHNIKRPGTTISQMVQKVRRKGYKGIKYGNVVSMFTPVPVKPSGKKVKLSREEDHANEYHATHKDIFGLDLPMDHPAPKWDPELSKRTAAAFEKAKDLPNHPKIRAAYDQLAKEVGAQHKFLESKGVKMEPWTKEGQPYANSKEMTADVRGNQHLWYFPSEKGQGQGEVEKPSLSPETNDKFRAVHDYFGHAVKGHQFGPKGELAAYGEHRKMFSPLARLALATETHGQNSWVNFGPNSHLPVTERPYAAQKATILPKNVVPLAREDAPHPEGWIDTEGQYYPNEKGANQHQKTLERLGHKEAPEGWVHVSQPHHYKTELHGWSEKRQYTRPQLATLNKIAKANDLLQLSLAHTENGKPTTRRLRLSRFGMPMPVDVRRPGNAKHVYAWIKPDGEVVHVPGSMHHRDVAVQHGFGSSDHAMQNGWVRVSSAGAALDGMNFVKTPNAKQLRALKDLAIQSQYDQASINDKPLRLAAPSSVIVKVPLPQPVAPAPQQQPTLKKPSRKLSYVLPI